MPKYRVVLYRKQLATLIVEAESEEAATEKAADTVKESDWDDHSGSPGDVILLKEETKDVGR